MTRTTSLLAAFTLLATGLPVAAQATALRAEFAAPFAQASQLVIDGKVWSCSQNACTSPGDDPRPAVACRKLARKAGPVVRFVTPRSELDAAGLASCNQDSQ